MKQPGKPLSEGMEKLMIEPAVVEILAKDFRADLSKFQLGSVIVWIVKQKFPPRSAAQR